MIIILKRILFVPCIIIWAIGVFFTMVFSFLYWIITGDSLMEKWFDIGDKINRTFFEDIF